MELNCTYLRRMNSATATNSVGIIVCAAKDRNEMWNALVTTRFVGFDEGKIADALNKTN